MLLLDATGGKVRITRSILPDIPHYEGMPYGIAYTNNFQVKGVAKISVMQFSAGYVDLEAYWAHMNAAYPEPDLGTWGGGKNAQGICCAGGSPVGTAVTPEQAAKALALFVL